MKKNLFTHIFDIEPYFLRAGLGGGRVRKGSGAGEPPGLSDAVGFCLFLTQTNQLNAPNLIVFGHQTDEYNKDGLDLLSTINCG